MPWFRLYHEARSDAKLRLLADDEHRVWFDLLCFASEQETRGSIATGDDRFPLAVEVSHGDIDLLARTVARLVKLRIVTDSGDRIVFIHFPDRQYDKPSATPERVAERVTRHRKGVTTAKSATETPVKRDETPFLFNTELERELDSEKERRRPSAAAPVAAAAAVVAPPCASKVVAVPKPNKLAEVIDAITAESIGVNPSKVDAAAVKQCPASAARLASAYVAAFRGEWPPDSTWLRDNLSLAAVCKRIDGYEAFIAGGERSARASPNGRPRVSTADDFAAYALRLEAEERRA
jgi:hypothetical protein